MGKTIYDKNGTELIKDFLKSIDLRGEKTFKSQELYNWFNISKRYFDNFYDKIHKIDFENIVLNSSDGYDGWQFEIIIGINNGFNKYSKKIGLWSPPCTKDKKSIVQINELLKIYKMVKKKLIFEEWYDNILLEEFKSFWRKKHSTSTLIET